MKEISKELCALLFPLLTFTYCHQRGEEIFEKNHLVYTIIPIFRDRSSIQMTWIHGKLEDERRR